MIKLNKITIGNKNIFRDKTLPASNWIFDLSFILNATWRVAVMENPNSKKTITNKPKVWANPTCPREVGPNALEINGSTNNNKR